MAFPVLIEHCDGQFAATLAGVPTIRVVGSTRAEVLAALQADLTQRLARGELVSLELNQTTQHWHTGSSRHHAVPTPSGGQVYESHVA